MSAAPSSPTPSKRLPVGGRPPEDLFPAVLYTMLGEIEALGLAEVVSWRPHGKAFAVHDRERFTTEVMPRFFKATKLRSFRRQLNLWGFRRIPSGRDEGAFWHPSFLRGRPELVRRIARAPASPCMPPDFYSEDATASNTPQDIGAREKVREMKTGIDSSSSSSGSDSDMHIFDQASPSLAPVSAPAARPRRVSMDFAPVFSMEAFNEQSFEPIEYDFGGLCVDGAFVLGFGMQSHLGSISIPRCDSPLTCDREYEDLEDEDPDEFSRLIEELDAKDRDDEFSRFIDQMIRDPVLA